jgi:hypothetical protein
MLFIEHCTIEPPKKSRFEKTTRQLMATHFRFHDCTGQFNINQQLTNQSTQSKTTIIESSTLSPATLYLIHQPNHKLNYHLNHHYNHQLNHHRQQMIIHKNKMIAV